MTRQSVFFTTPGGLRSCRFVGATSSGEIRVTDAGGGEFGPLSRYRNLTLGNSAIEIKATGAKVYGWMLQNDTDDVCYLRFFSSEGAPTVGTTPPFRSIPYGPQSVGEVSVVSVPQFETPLKLWVCVVKGNPDTGNTALSKTVFLEVFYL